MWRGSGPTWWTASRAQVNDKRYYALSRLTQLMCEGEARRGGQAGGRGARRRPHPAEAVEALSGSCCPRRRSKLDPHCGSAAPDRVAEALSAALSGLPRSEERLEADCEVRLHAGAEPRLEEERMDVTQGKLALGFRTGGITCWEEDYPALVMCNAVFGATPLSKLFLNVREKRSLCYYASSNLEKMKGLLLVSSGIEFGQYQQARDEILAQLEAVRRGEIEDWELEGARRTLIGGHRSTLDDQSRLEEFWLGQTAAGLDTGIEELVEGLKAVTREQVAAAAQKLEATPSISSTERRAENP